MTMDFTYRELETLTGLNYSLLRNWCSRGLIEVDGDGAGTKNDPVTFTEEMVYRLMWIAQLGELNVTSDMAIHLWLEAISEHQCSAVIITGDKYDWAPTELYAKRVKSMFDNHHAFVAVSVPHFMASAKSRIANFESVRTIRTKIDLHEPAELVH
jgi:hypothetical protein